MLSITMITAITAVALPHLRITTLSIMRSMVLAYALATFILMQGSLPAVVILFSQAIVVDTMGTYLVLTAIIILTGVLSFYTSRVIYTTSTPYTITVLIGVILIGSYYLIMSEDLVTIVLSLEIQSFSLYALTALHRWREGATSAGLIYFILGAFSSGVVLLGLAITYAYTGETVLSSIGTYAVLLDDRYMTTALILTVSGLLFKVTAAPFHYWGPEVYDRVPTAITIFINIMPKFALMGFIARFTTVLGTSGVEAYLYLSMVLSWAFGSIVGLVQTRIKRLLAYSTISHVGWMLAAIAGGTTIGLGSFIFYLLQYSATSALSFITLIAISYTMVIKADRSSHTHSLNAYEDTAGNTIVSDVETITSISGIYPRYILYTVVIGVTLFSAAGIPPMVGFYAKLSVMQAILYSLSPLYVVIGVISSVVSAGFYLSVISTMLFKPSKLKGMTRLSLITVNIPLLTLEGG